MLRTLLLLVAMLAMPLLGWVMPIAHASSARTIAIVDITNQSQVALPGIGEYASEFLTTRLASEPIFRVVERQKLQALLTEQGFTMSGLVDNTEHAVRAGRLLGADLIATGTILEVNQRTIDFQGYNIQSRQTVLEVVMSLKVINTETGVVEYGDIISTTSTQLEFHSLRMQDTGAVRRLARDLMLTAAERLIEYYSDAGNGGRTAPVHPIRIESTPDGADVLLDGLYVGATPLTIPLEEGVYLLEIRLAGYSKWENRIRVYDGLQVRVTLAKEQ